jgi:fructose 1,6-bisphosphate aldolase/phosphatase
MKVTLSVIKADIGGWVGHSHSHPEILELARKALEDAKDKKKILDYYVTACGDDLELIMTHKKGDANKEIHGIAWDIFLEGTARAKQLKLYGAGQDILKTAFSGNLKGMGPGVAEMTFEERPSEPVIVFMADKTEPGAWSIPLYKMFVDPFYNPGLVIDPDMHEGFKFTILDVIEKKLVTFSCPEEIYDMLALMGTVGRYEVKEVRRKAGNEICAVTSTDRLSLIAGRYVGKDDPVMIVRAQKGLPDVGEVLEPFATPYFVAGWNRGSHNGPFMPVSEKDAHMSRFDGPPRVMALGFQLSEGMLGLPADMFDDVGFDKARAECNDMANFIRRNGPFQPHRLEPSEMEYTTLAEIMKKLKMRFKKA